MPEIEQQSGSKGSSEIRYLTPLNINTVTKKKYCRFKFVNEQGKILPRRLTGTSLKYQRKVSLAVKRARHLALMPYVSDLLK